MRTYVPQRQTLFCIHSRISGSLGLGFSFKQRHGGHHHAGGAKAALQRAFVKKRLLHRVQPIAACQCLRSS